MAGLGYLGVEADNGWMRGVLGHKASRGGDVGGHIGGRLLLGKDEQSFEEGEGGAGLRGDLQEGHRVLVVHIVADGAVCHESLLDAAGRTL